MPLPIQDASLTDRLRRFFRLRGRVGFSLDETVVPMVLVEDLSLGRFPEKTNLVGVNIRANGRTSTVPPTGPSVVACMIGNIDANSTALAGTAFRAEYDSYLKDRFVIESMLMILTAEQVKNLASFNDAIEMDIRLTTKVDLLGVPTFTSQQAFLERNTWDRGAGVTIQKRPPKMFSWPEIAGSMPGNLLATTLLGVTVGSAGYPPAEGLSLVLGRDEALAVGPSGQSFEGADMIGIGFLLAVLGKWEPDSAD